MGTLPRCRIALLRGMHHRLLVHVVWTTRGRAVQIDADRARRLREQLPRIAAEERAMVLAIGIVADHLHLLLRLHPTTQLPRLLQRMKGGTAHAVNAHLRP
ncbi:MAG: transposase, partial [Gemmatimonadetes bacterium]|nr:transposase [Gemmatimonadota bacterium]